MGRSELRIYGQELGRLLGVDSPQSLLLATSASASLAVTALKSCSGQPDISPSIRPEKGFTVSVHLRQPDVSGWGTWIDGKFQRIDVWESGGVGIYDLQSDPRVLRTSAYETIHFNVPRATLNAFTDDAESPTIQTLRCFEGRRDPVLHHLAQMIEPALSMREGFSDLFLDHFVQLVCSRLVSAYSTVSLPVRPCKGGLAPWQKRRTSELLDEHLGGDLRLARLASECGLSTSYFCRCFRTSFGTSVHKFIIGKRIDRAKELLLETSSSLAEIAISTGFSDQSAFSRTFGACVGFSPAKWRTENLARRKLFYLKKSSVSAHPIGTTASIATRRSTLTRLG